MIEFPGVNKCFGSNPCLVEVTESIARREVVVLVGCVEARHHAASR